MCIRDRDSTIYVTLEPCCHHGKTPPCVDKIVANGIKKVVIGIKDPNPLVCGKGIEKLKENGVEVVSGVLKNECIEHHKRFLSYIINKRPYIILKWAETADGFIAPKEKNINEPYWISNTKSRQIVHKWRSEEQAILVGAKTIREDDPRLTTRDWEGKNCDIYILSKKGFQKNYKIFNQDSKVTILNDKKIDFEEGSYGIDDLKEASSIWFTSTTKGIVGVEEIINLETKINPECELLEICKDAFVKKYFS